MKVWLVKAYTLQQGLQKEGFFCYFYLDIPYKFWVVFAPDQDAADCPVQCLGQNSWDRKALMLIRVAGILHYSLCTQ